ncbi:MAG: hypothetical protein OJF60_003368 [Burkholderiaceae bacterium]|jgi:hypothetical protein|nr:MAG: hypothetical protein OJF60_003368 [Burkholderiaceae bacterium]
MVYIYGLLSIYLSYIFTRQIKYNGKLFLALGILCISGIAIFRGNVGTDTISYEEMASAIRFGYESFGLEPGFLGLIELTQKFINNETYVIRIIALTFCLTLFVYLLNANRNEIFYLFVFYIPCFFYQNSMNVLRIGLASNFLLLSIQHYRKANFKIFSLLVLLAVIFHYSTILVVFYCWALIKDNSRKQMAYVTVFVLLFFVILFYLNPMYLLQKVDLYSDYKSPSSLSGMGRLLSIIVLIVGVYSSNLPIANRNKISFWAIVVCTGCYLGTFFTYAALRFLDLSFFAFSISTLLTYNRLNLNLNRNIKYAFFISGLVSFAASYHGWVAAFNSSESPFLPYRSLWVM